MKKISTIEIFREDLGFSAGHFTIFSATHREGLHGHNYLVSAAITTEIEKHGLRFDYRIYHEKIKEICQKLNLHFLLPANSEFLKIVDDGDYYKVHFDQDVIPFLKKDVLILPIANTTIEELSHWFLQQLTNDQNELDVNGVQNFKITISSNVGRSGSASWVRS